MNYRHAYHAGNFADVLKHAILALVIEHMKLKPAPFRVIDAHAGAGVYDLSLEGEKTGEWRDGLGRLLDGAIPEPAAGILAPYLAAVRAENPHGGLRFYPGSPALARRLVRDCDRLVFNELHPEDRERLRRGFARDRRVKILGLDAWIALKSLLPPRERRAVVLIDPPFEAPGEFARAARGLKEALDRFATGVFLAWYPIKDEAAAAAFHGEMARLGRPDVLRAEMSVAAAPPGARLAACGLLVLNPPHTLPGKVEALMPFLSARLARGGGGFGRVDWLSPPK